MDLGDLMKGADRDQEPARDQWAILDGDKTVTMLVVLDRTAVIQLGHERVLVSHYRLEVDAGSLRWQTKEMSAREGYVRHRYRRALSA
jgi:hypothetical protein